MRDPLGEPDLASENPLQRRSAREAERVDAFDARPAIANANAAIDAPLPRKDLRFDEATCLEPSMRTRRRVDVSKVEPKPFAAPRDFADSAVPTAEMGRPAE